MRYIYNIKVMEGSDPKLYRSPNNNYGKWVKSLLVAPPTRNPHEYASESDSDNKPLWQEPEAPRTPRGPDNSNTVLLIPAPMPLHLAEAINNDKAYGTTNLL